MLTLCTSLAPQLNRIDDHGLECGMAYQQACVQSWQAMGANVVAVNVMEELPWAQEMFPGVGLIPAPEDSRAHNQGRPLPYIHDLVRAAGVQAETRFCGLINSDIFLKDFEPLWPSLQARMVGGLLVCRRMEMSWPSFQAHRFYPFGFDMFLMDRRVGASLPESKFAVGIPWWDFWLPLMAYLRGFNLYRVDVPVAYHLQHAARWDEAQFVEYGAQLVECLRVEAQATLSNPTLAIRGQFILDGLQMIEEAAECDIRELKYTSGLSKYLEWFFDKGPAVRGISE